VRTRAREHLVDEPLVELEREFATRFVRIPPQLPGGACRDPRLRARAGRRGRAALGWWCLDGLDERLPVSRRQWPTVRDLVT
jgi:two-component system response regulator AlgR